MTEEKQGKELEEKIEASEENTRELKKLINEIKLQNIQLLKEIALLKKVEETKEVAISREPLIPSLEDVQVDGDNYKSISDSASTVVFPLPEGSGIFRLEVLNISNLQEVGIIDSSANLRKGQLPMDAGWEKMIYYGQGGGVGHIGDNIKGNTEFKGQGHHIAIELNMESNPHTLTFFQNNVEQPNYIIGINTPVNFYVLLFKKDQCFQLTSIERILLPTAKHNTVGSRALEWGKEWKKDS